MQIGLCLPNYRPGASAESLEAALETAARLGWHSVWTTDHLLVDRASADEYGTLLEAITTLAYAAATDRRLLIGTSVIVVPQRNAVLLAKEFATLDVLSRGRLIVGVGIGWNRTEYGNLGVADRFPVRGAYLDETIALWRHLWSGVAGPFAGRFHRIDDFAFGPLPVQGTRLPIWVGGPSAAALTRAGRLGDGYQSSGCGPPEMAVRVPVISTAAQDAGRPMPRLSARIRVVFGPAEGDRYVMAGTPEQMATELAAFAAQGVEHVALDFAETDPQLLAALMERFDAEVAPLLGPR